MKRPNVSVVCRALATLCAAVVLHAPAAPQNFNVDLDIFFGGPEIGNGAPSDAFGGAAGMPGRWNRIPMLGSGPYDLVDINGNPTSVHMSAVWSQGHRGGGGTNQQINSGDFKLLLDDAATVADLRDGGTVTYYWNGLSPGPYDLYVYAVHRVGWAIDAPVFAANTSSPNPQIVRGPMPGNTFALHVTHSVHRIQVTDGSMRAWIVQAPGLQHNLDVNGLQIVAVGEPSTVCALLLAGAGIFYKSRRKSLRANGIGL